MLTSLNLKGVHTITVVASGTLVMNANLDKETFGGKNIVMLGKKLVVPQGAFTIDVSGTDGPAPAGKPSKPSTPTDITVSVSGTAGAPGNNAST